jgi:4-amino-4-deoxy-L-arabinose transferase-like glycosyltransferase
MQVVNKTLVGAISSLNHRIVRPCKHLQNSMQNVDTNSSAAFKGPSLSRLPVLIHSRIAKTLLFIIPVLLPLFILIGSGLRGLDFGFHWDEMCCQIRPVQTMVKTGILLPEYYYYPSFNYWVSIAGLIPDFIDVWPEKGNRQQQLLQAMEGHSYRLRLRAIYLVMTSLAVLWVYLLVLHWRRSWVEALLASSFLALSWEVAYHLRWIATDGMLMQFGALTLLFMGLSWSKPDGRPWLTFAAVTGGLACGTKYPGAALLVPVLVGGYLTWDGKSPYHVLIRLLVKLTVIFTGVYLITTPGTVLQPIKFLEDMLSVRNLYLSGHLGHTVSPGLEHGWRVFIYLSSVLFSPYAPIALLFFVLFIIGACALVKESPKTAILFLCFPTLYVLYFCMQRALVVRNLLVITPFMAILAARGTAFLWEHLKLKGRTGGLIGWLKLNILQAGFATVILTSLLVNAGWLIYAAETIVDRKTDRFVREVAAYISTEKSERFLLSPRVRVHLSRLGLIQFPNVTDDPTQAEQAVFYASEGMKHWPDWPANRPRLTNTWFGPYEVNFNIYPNWEGDDRIIIMSIAQAQEIGILVVGNNQTKTWWAVPEVDPCTLVSKAEAEAIMGPLREGPRPGGSTLGGTSCAYISTSPFIVNIGVIDTWAFKFQKNNPGNTAITDLGDEAYTVKPNSLGDVYLFVRKGMAAIMVNVTAGAGGGLETKKSQIATDLAEQALNHLLAVRH